MAFMPGGRCLRDHSIKMGQQISLMSANDFLTFTESMLNYAIVCASIY